MRAIILAMLLAAAPSMASAQTEGTVTTEPVAPSVSEPAVGTESPAEMAPMPTESASVDGYRVAAIAAGAVGGVIVANMLTGGMATPVMMGTMGNGGMALMGNGGMWLTGASQLVVTAAGALAGGYVGDWLYSQ